MMPAPRVKAGARYSAPHGKSRRLSALARWTKSRGKPAQILCDCANFLSAAQVNRDELADPAFGHRHTVQSIHSGHGHAVMGDDQETGRSDLGNMVEQIAEPVHIGVIERASTSSSTQMGAGLVRNTAKSRAVAVRACSPPESSERESATSCLAGWHRSRYRLPAGLRHRSVPDVPGHPEQADKQILEVLIDFLEGCQQALARFAVQAGNATP